MPHSLAWSSERSVRIASADPVRIYHALRAAALEGVVDLTPGFGCVQVEFDPLAFDPQRAEQALTAAIDRYAGASAANETRSRTVPVCYEPPHAPDLAALAERVGLNTKQVIALHTAGAYRVEVIGFSPGFGYLAGLPEALPASTPASTRRPHPAAGT